MTWLTGGAEEKKKVMGGDRMHLAMQVPKLQPLVKLALTPTLIGRRVKGHNVFYVCRLREGVEIYFSEEGTYMK